jgi:hypothetical protein
MGALGRILCAIDLEKASERAFDRALSLAILGHAQLFIFHATPAGVLDRKRGRGSLKDSTSRGLQSSR